MQAASINRDLKSEQISDLVALAQKGDPDAFRTIYEEYVGQIYALCLRFTADPVKAEDRTQSAFIRAWEKLDTYRGEGGFIHESFLNLDTPSFGRGGKVLLAGGKLGF